MIIRVTLIDVVVIVLTLGERLVTRPLSTESNRAQPEKEAWICPHVGPPSTGGAIEVWCYVDHAAVKGREYGSPMLGC